MNNLLESLDFENIVNLDMSAEVEKLCISP